jgi:hypothetical protein
MGTIASRPGKTRETPGTAGETTASRQQYVMLGMATVGFALTFWAWALLSPLGAHFKQELSAAAHCPGRRSRRLCPSGPAWPRLSQCCIAVVCCDPRQG